MPREASLEDHTVLADGNPVANGEGRVAGRDRAAQGQRARGIVAETHGEADPVKAKARGPGG